MSASGARPRATVDTNLFVSGAISPTGSPRRLLRAWTDGRFHLVLSDDHHAELADVFGRPKLAGLFRIDPDDLAELLAGLSAVPRVTPSPAIPVAVRDPKDAKILAAALGGEAEYLVTGDADLLALAGDPRLGGLRIVTVVVFLGVLERAAGNGGEEA